MTSSAFMHFSLPICSTRISDAMDMISRSGVVPLQHTTELRNMKQPFKINKGSHNQQVLRCILMVHLFRRGMYPALKTIPWQHIRNWSSHQKLSHDSFTVTWCSLFPVDVQQSADDSDGDHKNRLHGLPDMSCTFCTLAHEHHRVKQEDMEISF